MKIMRTLIFIIFCIFFLPAFLVGTVAQFLARLLLSFAYLLLTDFLPAKNVFKNAFCDLVSHIKELYPKRFIKDLNDFRNGK